MAGVAASQSMENAAAAGRRERPRRPRKVLARASLCLLVMNFSLPLIQRRRLRDRPHLHSYQRCLPCQADSRPGWSAEDADRRKRHPGHPHPRDVGGLPGRVRQVCVHVRVRYPISLRVLVACAPRVRSLTMRQLVDTETNDHIYRMIAKYFMRGQERRVSLRTFMAMAQEHGLRQEVVRAPFDRVACLLHCTPNLLPSSGGFRGPRADGRRLGSLGGGGGGGGC